MTNPLVPPQSAFPPLQGNLSAADIINMRNLQIPHATEAYYMQTRQSELEAIYTSFADLHEVYDSLSINEWIDILSCIRGLNASGLLNKLRSKDAGFKAALHEAQCKIIDIKMFLEIAVPTMMPIFNSNPVVAAHYAVPTGANMMALREHVAGIERTLQTLREGMRQKEELTNTGPMTASSSSSSAPRTNVTESRPWQASSKIWSETKTLTVAQYFKKDENRSVDDYLVYFHSQFTGPLNYLDDASKQDRLRELFVHAVEDQESRLTPYKSHVEQGNVWGTMLNAQPDTCISWIRQQFRYFLQNEYPTRRMRSFQSWLQNECQDFKKDLSSAGKIIMGRLQVLLRDIKCYDVGACFPPGGPNPNPATINMEAVLVEGWHEAIKACPVLNPLLSYINSEKQKLLVKDEFANTLSISFYLQLLSTYQYKPHDGSISSSSASSSSSSSGSVQINYIAAQTPETLKDRPVFKADSTYACRYDAHVNKNLKPHHWKDCPDNPKCWRTSDPQKWADWFHYPKSAATNPTTDPKQCGSNGPLFLAENRAAASNNNNAGRGKKGGK